MVSKVEFIGQAIGYRMIDGQSQTVYSDEFEKLMVDDAPGGGMRQAGYVFTKPKCTINLIRRFEPADFQAIHRLVQEQKGDGFVIGQPPQPREVDDDEEDDEDDDET